MEKQLNEKGQKLIKDIAKTKVEISEMLTECEVILQKQENNE